MTGELEKVATAIRENLKARTFHHSTTDFPVQPRSIFGLTEHDIARVAILAIADGHAYDGTDEEGSRVCRHPDHYFRARGCFQASLAEEIS